MFKSLRDGWGNFKAKIKQLLAVIHFRTKSSSNMFYNVLNTPPVHNTIDVETHRQNSRKTLEILLQTAITILILTVQLLKKGLLQ